MSKVLLLIFLLAFAIVLCGCVEPEPVNTEFKNQQKVQILGYSGDAMEPFISRDGKYLFFNSLNSEPVNTNIYYATPDEEGNFLLAGEVGGVNSVSLDAVASVDNQGNFYFVSARSYNPNAGRYSSIYSGYFGDGTVSDVALVPGNIDRKEEGWINTDAEISPDGKTLFFARSFFPGTAAIPQKSDIFIASNKNGQFAVAANSSQILQNVNTEENLEYAPSISSDGLELFFTRLNPRLETTIYVAKRSSVSGPFGRPERIDSVIGFAEAPSVSGDGKTLFFHKKDGPNFSIYRVSRE